MYKAQNSPFLNKNMGNQSEFKRIYQIPVINNIQMP